MVQLFFLALIAIFLWILIAQGMGILEGIDETIVKDKPNTLDTDTDTDTVPIEATDLDNNVISSTSSTNLPDAPDDTNSKINDLETRVGILEAQTSALLASSVKPLVEDATV